MTRTDKTKLPDDPDDGAATLPTTARLEREILGHLTEAVGIDQERRYWTVLEALRAGRRDAALRRLSTGRRSPSRSSESSCRASR